MKLVGIGTMSDSGALILTQRRSRECGYNGGEGSGGSPEEHDARRAVVTAAQDHADATGRPVDIYAAHPRWQMWQVEQIMPRITPPQAPEMTDAEMSRMYGAER